MPQGEQIRFPILTMQCNRQAQNGQFHSHDPIYLISFTNFPVHRLSSHHTPLCSSTNVRLPLTITQTIPSPSSPPKAPSTTIPRLRS